MRHTLTVSRDLLTNLGVDASVLAHWIGDARTDEICHEVIETFLVSFTEPGQPGEGVRIVLADSETEPQAWAVTVESEDARVLRFIREVIGEAGIGLDLGPKERWSPMSRRRYAHAFVIVA